MTIGQSQPQHPPVEHVQTEGGSPDELLPREKPHAPARRTPFTHAQWVLPLVVFLMEFALKGGTTGGFWPSAIFIALFSLEVGQIVYLLSSILSEERANTAIRTTLALLLGISFCVTYFVYREFDIFYDLNTVTSGAGHAKGQFLGQIVELLVSPRGLLMIALMCIPTIASLTIGKRLLPATRATADQRVTSGVLTVTAYAFALLLAESSGSFGRVYMDRFNFNDSVKNFGLMASVQRELELELAHTDETVVFVEDDAPPTRQATADSEDVETPEDLVSPTDAGDDAVANDAKTAGSPKETRREESHPQPEEEPDWGANVLDIDFAALAESTEGTWESLDSYVATQQPSSKNEQTGRFAGYNLIFISAEAFSAEAIREDTTPTLYRLATKGIQFLDYYQPAGAGTTGGEYQNVFGMLATDGGASFKDTAYHNNELTMGWALNGLGYKGWAFHNNDYTYYDRDITHNMIGYSHGYMGWGNGMEEWVEPVWPESDLEMIQGTFDNLYGDSSPFNVYYMSVSGHSTYWFDSNRMSAKYRDVVEDLPYSEPVKAYLACNIDLDRAVQYLVEQLEEKGIADCTVIVIAADHFPYGLDNDGALGYLPYLSELYGYDVQTSFQRDHNRLIIWSESLEDEKPLVVDEPTSSLDILPTLLNLFGVEWDSRMLVGRDVFSDRSALVFDLSYNWKTELGTYYAGSDRFEPVEGAEVPEGYVESVNTTVANKISYCAGVLNSDYYRHVFGDPRDVNEVNEEGRSSAKLADPKP